MLNLQAESVSVGIGDGLLYRFEYSLEPNATNIENANDAFTQLENNIKIACDNIENKLNYYTEKKLLHLDYINNHFKILSAQKAMLTDEEFLKTAKEIVIEKNHCIQYALKTACETYTLKLRTNIDEFLKFNCEKINSIYKTIIQNISEDEFIQSCLSFQNRIIVYINSPISINTLIKTKDKICAIIINENQIKHAHTIFTCSSSIPCVIFNDEYNELKANLRTMVDGQAGKIIQEPDSATKTILAQKHLVYSRTQRGVGMLKGVPASTVTGNNIKILAAVSQIGDVRQALDKDADSIGLLIPDVLFSMQEIDVFDEDKIYNAYRDILLLMGRKAVNVLLYPCADTQSYKFVDETSSFESRMYNTNLRALLRASAYGSLSITLSDITNADVIHEFKNDINILREQLKKENRIISTNIKVGTIITNPYSALIADIIYHAADFISIDINALSDSLFASGNLANNFVGFEKVHNYALLRCVAQIMHLLGKSGDKNLSITGLSAGDVSFADFYAALQVKELCMLPASIPSMKRAIRSLTKEDLKMALNKHLMPKNK